MNTVKPLQRENAFFSQVRRRMSRLTEIPEKQEPSQKLKDVLKSLAESSSLHGIPKIVSAPQIAVKVLWCLLFLATFGVLTYQVYNLFSTYYSNPVDTTVSLQFSPHRFPALTICNMNPVMVSNMPSELKKIWSQKKKKSSRKRRSADEGDNHDYDYDVYDIIDDIKDIENAIGGLKDSNNENGNLRDVQTAKHAGTADSGISESSILTNSDITSNDRELLEQYIAPTPVDRSGIPEDARQLQPSEASILDDYLQKLEMFENKYFNRKRRGAPMSSSSSSSSTVDPSSEPSSSYSNNYYYYYGGNYYNYYDSSSDSYSSDYSSSSYYGSSPTVDITTVLSGERDNWEWLRRNFQYRFKSMPIANRTEIGHKIDDMVLKLSFLGFNRNISRFKRMATPEYGNCYTLDDELFVAWRSGPTNGISLTMNLQKDEYMQGFGSGYGVRIVFHETGTFPLPAAEGITLSPGTDTNIALKMVKLSRLGKPYGECTDGNWFRDQFDYKYSSATCLQICRSDVVLAMCGCVPFDDPEIGSERHGDAPVCDMTNKTVEQCILVRADGALAEGHFKCECPVPCSEYVFEKTMSWRQWPNSDYLVNVLVKELCKRNMTSTEDITNANTLATTTNCSSGNNTTTNKTTIDICHEDAELNVFEWQKNFLRVQIYYEDLNYEFITEKPSYEKYCQDDKQFGS